MRTVRKRFLPGMCVLLGLALASPASAKDKPISKKDLPPAVLAAFEAAYPKAVIKGLATETEEGKTYFEIESVDGQTSRDILYVADGTVAEVEEGIAPAALPAPVQAAVSEKHPHARIVKAEKTTRGAMVTYELRVVSGTKKMGLVVDENGKILEKKKTSARKGEKNEKR